MSVVVRMLVAVAVGAAVFVALGWLGGWEGLRGIAGPAVVGVCCGVAAATRARS
ncbi:hypothetical protein [Kitasatospora sp. NPDC059571]|uniref:hypothetical protein n=1 Tax=Kitasatospora sp. NPDC059571 TaxID=3346871 RepID=UPI003679FBF4